MAKDLTEGSVLLTILSTSWPMVVAFTLQSAFNIVDAYFVGKISADALAAVSVSFPVVFLIIALATGLGVGSTSLIARCFGAKNYVKAGEVAEHALVLAIALSIFFMVGGIASTSFLFSLMGVTEVVNDLALDYIHIILLGSPIFFLAMVGNSIIRGEGEMKFPMYGMGAAAILNIILDPICIFTLGWGVKGAAIATIAARAFGMLIIFAYFFMDKTWLKIKLHKFSFNLEYVKGIFSVGVPSSISNLSMSIGMFLLTIIVAGFGTEALAAFGIGFRLDSLAILPALGVSISVVSLVGQNVGAGQFKRAEEMTYKAGLFATACMALLGLFFMIFSRQIIMLFNNDPLVVSYGSSFLRIVPISYFFVGLSIVISGAFLGSGHALPSLALTIIRVIIFNIPLAYLLSRTMGIQGIWYGILFSSLIAFIVAVAWFRRGRWKTQKKQLN
ncbi:MAG: MATE family efflux transporter [Methanobacteriota archaeon]